MEGGKGCSKSVGVLLILLFLFCRTCVLAVRVNAQCWMLCASEEIRKEEKLGP